MLKDKHHFQSGDYRDLFIMPDDEFNEGDFSTEVTRVTRSSPPETTQLSPEQMSPVSNAARFGISAAAPVT